MNPGRIETGTASEGGPCSRSTPAGASWRPNSRPLPGRYILVTLTPHREWALGRLGPARHGQVELVEGVRYRSPEQAEWDIFKRRWQELTGETLDIE